LQTTSIDCLQAHWSPAYFPWQENALLDGLADAAEAGLCRCVGVSNYGPVALRRVYARFARQGIALASNQVQFSLLKRSAERTGLLEVAAELGVTMIGYSPLALGLLSGAYSRERQPPGLRGLLFSTQADAALDRLLALLQAIASERRVPLAAVAVNWTRSRDLIPILGVRSPVQARDALACLSFQLSAGEIAELDAASLRCREVTDNIFETK